MIVGVDCGNHNLKLVTATTRLTFPRFVMKSKPLVMSDGTEKWRVSVDGKEYFIGYLAQAEDGNMAFERDKATHEHTIPLVFGAIAIVNKTTTYLPVKIVSGLPLVDMAKQADTYRKSLMGEHTVSVNGGQSQIIYVQDVIIFGEGAGAIWDSVLDTTGKFKRKPQTWERVIDIGYRTVDFCALQNMFYVESQSTSFPGGIFQAQEKTYHRLSQERDVKLENVEPGDLELRDLAQKIVSHMNRIWIYDKENIQLAGGGAYLLRKYLQYPMMPDPEWANASGYYKVGVVKWRGEF